MKPTDSVGPTGDVGRAGQAQANAVAQEESRPRTTPPERRRELDVMGALVVVGLAFFHTLRTFSGMDTYVMNEPPSMVALFVVAFASLWGMPLMFLIAGMAIWYSLRRRTAGEFLRERVRRLLVPFVTGMLIIVPVMIFYELKGDPTYQESYAQFYPRFFNVSFALSAFPQFLKGALPDGLFRTGHLYFLNYLFVYTLLLLPLFLYLRQSARPLIERLALFCTRPWAIFLLGLPIAVIEAAHQFESAGGWSRYAYIPFIVYGFLFAADARFGQALQRQRKRALILGVVVFLVYMGGQGALFWVADVDPFTGRDPASVLVRFVKAMDGWFWVVAIMGLAGHMSQRGAQSKRQTPASGGQPPSQSPDRPRKPSLMDRIGEYANDAQLPFYVLHYAPVVVIGFYVVQWQIGALVKYLVITLSSLLVTLVLYDIGVRRTQVTRFLFGMRPRQTPIEAPANITNAS